MEPRIESLKSMKAKKRYSLGLQGGPNTAQGPAQDRPIGEEQRSGRPGPRPLTLAGERIYAVRGAPPVARRP